MKGQKTVVIFNARSGKGEIEKKQDLFDEAARKAGYIGEIWEVAPDQSFDQLMIRAVKDGYKKVIVGGGDGTIQQALEVAVKYKVVLGIVPTGTGNILAQNLGIPLTIPEAMQVAMSGVVKNVDLGIVNNRYFALSASVGLAAEVMRKTTRKAKKMWGMLAYAVVLVKVLQHRAKKYEVEVDKKIIFSGRAKMVIVSNVGMMAGGVEAMPGEHAESGYLSVGILKTNNLASWYDFFINLVKGRVYESKYFDVVPAKRVVIKVKRKPVNYEADGTRFERVSTLEIEVKSAAIKVCVPVSVITNVLMFDFDGTIADTFELMTKIYNELAEKHKLKKLTAAKINKLRSKGARTVIDELKISPLLVPILIAEGRGKFADNLKSVEPFAGMEKVLNELKKRYKLGIVTSNDKNTVELFLRHNKLLMFDFVFSEKYLFGKGKLIKDVLKTFNFDRERVRYVGDEVRDVEAAREAGIKVTAVSWGFNSREALEQAGPDQLVDHVYELVKEV